MAQNSNNDLEAASASLSSSVIIINPIGELKDARERKDWASGFSKAVTSFEYFGRNAIKAYFRLHGVGVDNTTSSLKEDFAKFLESLDVSKIVQFLYWFDMIGEEVRKHMFKINDERNKLGHAKEGMGYQYYDDKHFQALLDQAIVCVEKLMSIRLPQKKKPRRKHQHDRSTKTLPRNSQPTT